MEAYTYAAFRPILPEIVAEAMFRWNVEGGRSRGHRYRIGNSEWLHMQFGYIIERSDFHKVQVTGKGGIHRFELQVFVPDQTIHLALVGHRAPWRRRFIPLVGQPVPDDWSSFRILSAPTKIIASTQTAHHSSTQPTGERT